MARAETVEFVKNSFNQQETVNGYTDPIGVARTIAGNQTSSLFNRTRESVLRMPTQEFLYEGARETLQDLLAQGDQVVIWTQGHERGQLWKVATSGLGKLRRDLPSEDRKRFSVYAAMDKVAQLPTLFTALQEKGADKVIIVDDKAKNILQADQQIKQWLQNGNIPQNIDVQLVWINQGRTKNQVPPEHTKDTFTSQFTTVEDIRELTNIRNQLSGKIGWLVDFDHTLVNTRQAQESMFRHLAQIVEESHPEPIVSYRVDSSLGLNGNVRSVDLLLSGMSGGGVFKVETDQDLVVIKYNPQHPERITREINGYHLLTGTPLSQRMMSPHYASAEDAVLALPFITGAQMRIGVQTETLPVDIACQTLAELLEIKRQWWTAQSQIQPNGELVSMQRTEWQDTVDKIQETVRTLSQRFQISVRDLWLSPLVFQNTEYPPLLTVAAHTANALSQKPPFAVLAHGDATGANILIDPVQKQWTLIDAEWVGLADPAEAYVRMSKWLSTTTVKDTKAISAEMQKGKIRLDLDLTFPQGASALQNLALSQVAVFADALNDPLFPQRVNSYFAGSYLREVALAGKRGKPEMALFAMLKASEAITR